MAVEVLFNPLRKIVVEDETGTVTKCREFPPLFKPVNWPDVHWIQYNTSASPWPFPKEKNIVALDTHTQEMISVFVGINNLAYVNWEDYMFHKNIDPFSFVDRGNVNYFEKYDQILQDFRSLCQVQKSFQKTMGPRNFSNWEELALQIASICVFISNQEFFYFSMRNKNFPISGGSISPQGDIFLDLPNSELGKGASRSFASAVWLNHQLVVAKGVRKISGYCDKLEVQNEMEALSSFNGNEGIIRTYSQGIFSAFDLFPTFFVYQERYQENLHGFFQKHTLSPQDQKDLIEQLLKGLVKFSDIGIHLDIRLSNILIRRCSSGKIKGVISDFGSFIRFGKHSLPPCANTESAPPEYHQRKPLTCKLDVWMLGLVFLYLCTKERPVWFRESQEDQIRIICNLSSHWSKPILERANISKSLVDLIDYMLMPDSRQRGSPLQALEFFLSATKKVGTV